ncbi:hypothetical protein KR222_001665, partial [Zaprionus bogoriensis]
ALPFEYLEEHEDDFNYDLDEAQSQAKYDARLLSEQMLSDAELQQRADMEAGYSSSSSANVNANSSPNSDSDNGGQSAAAAAVGSSAVEDDLEPHSRAAACFTNGHKYTHGQKVPRLDACEVCLCMDGEIFCWWEKCDKANSVNSAQQTAEAAEPTGDYSDPYRLETTTRKSTKLHKAERKAGKRHKHHKNQKNFNDYEVYHSRKQAPDYKKPDIKQQKQKADDASRGSSSSSSSSSSNGSSIGSSNNYNIIRQHKHEQQQELATSTAQQQQQQLQQQRPHVEPQPAPQPQQQNFHMAATTTVNQAAKEAHYQHQLQPPPQRQQQQQQHEQNPQQHLHAHQQHSTSKILNFPENLPALLYYDYKTEEHEHHQHQHHQQHLLHEKQRQQQQQQQQQQQRLQQQRLQQQQQKAHADVELSTDLGIDKNFDEAETDSDILPEPPTKRPTQPAATLTASSSSSDSSSSNNSSSSSSQATTMAVATTIEMMTTPRSQHAATVGNTNLHQLQQHQDQEIEDADDAFHRWLTSTELNVDSTNTLDDNLPAVVASNGAVVQETPASTIIDDVGVGVNSSSSSSSPGSIIRDGSSSGSNDSIAVKPKDNGNRRGNNIADNADAVFFRSSYNDYSSEFNGSVVNIDITLTAVDVHPQRPQQPKAAPAPTAASASAAAAAAAAAAVGQTDLIANDNQTSDVRLPAATSTAAAAAPIGGSNQHSVPPYTLTTIITTTPLETGRMCNVLGKLYKIGEVLPQDTGNCLQCICTDAVTPDELPSVTCSPHNCPPLVLPDLFDATGY